MAAVAVEIAVSSCRPKLLGFGAWANPPNKVSCLMFTDGIKALLCGDDSNTADAELLVAGLVILISKATMSLSITTVHLTLSTFSSLKDITAWDLRFWDVHAVTHRLFGS